jgi:hypothetical protein
VVLNMLFRIGVRKSQVLELTPGVDHSQKVFEFMETRGGAWGARRDVVMRAEGALNEFLESASALGFVKGKARADVSFDEFNLDVEISYDGDLMEFPSGRPSPDARSATHAVTSLSGYLIRQYADSVDAEAATAPGSPALRSLRNDVSRDRHEAEANITANAVDIALVPAVRSRSARADAQPDDLDHDEHDHGGDDPSAHIIVPATVARGRTRAFAGTVREVAAIELTERGGSQHTEPGETS